MIKLAITCGDINGIGPEIIFKSISNFKVNSDIIFRIIIPKNIYNTLESRKMIQNLNSNIEFDFIEDSEQEIGKPTIHSGITSYKAILKAHELATRKEVDGIVTAPISKEAFQLANVKFKGHTDLLFKITKSKSHMMVFLSDKMVTGLTTIHIPIKEISRKLSQDLLVEKILLGNKFLKNDLGIDNPKIAVLGLNPHAGENGILGNEEIQIINPVIKNLKQFINVEGAFVPDAFFGMQKYLEYDFVLGIYHDQVLIPFKLLNFNSGVNYTAGLPYVRTSPDHGTAFDIAWQNKANPKSFIESINWAIKIIKNRREKL